MANKRLGPDDYFLGIAVAVSLRSNCIKRKVGAVVVVGGRIVSTGYNGTPSGMTNCFDGGCERCADPDLPSGASYDRCVCAHAERNAIYFAARHGTAVNGGVMYSTLRPCSTCVEACVQSGITAVRFAEEWPEGYDRPPEYQLLVGRITNGVSQI